MPTSSTAPTRIAKYARTATRASLAVLMLYSVAKVLTIAFSVTVPFLSSPADPFLALFLSALGVSWLVFGGEYYRVSRNAKQFSETYTEILPEDSDHYDSFRTGVTESYRHTLQSGMAILTGFLFIATALWYATTLL